MWDINYIPTSLFFMFSLCYIIIICYFSIFLHLCKRHVSKNIYIYNIVYFKFIFHTNLILHKNPLSNDNKYFEFILDFKWYDSEKLLRRL